MKKIALLLLIVLIFAGCVHGKEQDPAPKEYLFTNSESAIFPFYCIGQDDYLWRVESKGAYSTKYRVNYSIGGNDKNFIKYLKYEDMVIFATDIKSQSGTTCATLCCQKGRNDAEIIANNVKLDSVKIENNGNMLFIDKDDTLFFRRDGIVTRIEAEVIQAEFVGEDSFLFRLKNGTVQNGEKCYPIYSATADYRNYLMDGLDIISADSENGKAYIIKNKRTVQKRTVYVEVAECFVYADGEVLFEIPSVVLSQFEEDKHIFLISCDESQATLKYDLYRVDGSAPELIVSDIISGKYISKERDVFAYEMHTAENVTTNIIDYTNEIKTYSLGENCSLDSIYSCKPYIYVFIKGELLLLDDNSTLIEDGIDKIAVMDNSLICFKEKKPPYSISVCTSTAITYRVKEVKSDSVQFKDGGLYYYAGEGNDLNMTDESGHSFAFVSNVDREIGFICSNGTVAVAKDDDKTLFIASRFGMCDGQLKIKKFITEE